MHGHELHVARPVVSVLVLLGVWGPSPHLSPLHPDTRKYHRSSHEVPPKTTRDGLPPRYRNMQTQFKHNKRQPHEMDKLGNSGASAANDG